MSDQQQAVVDDPIPPGYYRPVFIGRMQLEVQPTGGQIPVGQVSLGTLPTREAAENAIDAFLARRLGELDEDRQLVLEAIEQRKTKA
jgi:hypothetical protein